MTTPMIPISALPAWMRPPRRAIDYGLLIAVAFGLLAAFPLIARAGLPPFTAAELYEFRSAEVARLIRSGLPYSRWAPNFNFLQGSPILNYLPPLSHLLPGYHQAITESRPLDSVKLFMIVSIMTACAGMYSFARRRWGGRVGMVAALLYTLSGPMALSLPYLYGELAPLMGLAALPWAAWSLDRARQSPSGPTVLATVISLSALLLADTRLAFFGGGALVVTALTRGNGGVGRLLALTGLVAGLTAFFWLPAVAERDQIVWQSAALPPYSGPIDPAEWFAPLPYADLTTITPPTYRGIGPAVGVAVLVAVIGGGVGGRVGRRRANSPLPPDSAAILTYGGMLLAFASSASAGLWPPASGFMAPLPYHAVMVASFCLAAAGGGAARVLDRLPERGIRPAAYAGLCLAVCGMSLPAAFPPVWATREASTSLVGSLIQEISGYQAATLREGVILPPGTAAIMPPPNLIDDVQAGRYDGIDREAFPSRVDLALIERGPLTWRYIVNLNQPARVVFNLLAFPGWGASLSGKAFPVGNEAGRIALDLPAANGELLLTFGRTPVRDVSWWVTAVTAVALFFVVRRWPPADVIELPPAFHRREYVALGAVFIVAAAGSFAVRQFPAALLPFRVGPPAEMAPLPRFLQDGIDMLGYYLPTKTAAPGQALSLSVYWQPARPLVANNQSEAWLVNPVGQQVVARVANRHPAGKPSLFWQLGRYVRDTFRLPLPPDLPEGDYVLQVVIGPCQIPSVVPCERVDGMDGYNAYGEVERGKITIPQVIRVRR